MPINFSGRHYPSAIIMQALRYYLAYKLSYREIEEIFAERNIHFDHSTLNRWVIKYSQQLEANFRSRKRMVMDEPAAIAFFDKALDSSGLPSKVVIDKSGANIAALDTLNVQLWLSGYMLCMIEVLTVKYLNNIVEQSHRKVKGKMHQCLGWKSWVGAEATLAGVELCSMLKQGQMIDSEDKTVWEQFYSLAA
ncbi:MAG: IS6 family transposase [Cycloclasticus sp.]